MSMSITSSVDTSSPFLIALDEYIQGLPEKARKRKFILECQRSEKDAITANDIHQSIQRMEEKKSQRSSKSVFRNVLSVVVRVMKDYDSVIQSLASADPMPTAIIWGALRIVIDGADRYLNLFEIIKSEIRSLTSYLGRITQYEYLYGESPALQKLLCGSYINILRFWSRVDKECDRSSSILRSATSFSTNKLKKIVEDINEDANQIEKLVPIIEAQLARKEREEAEEERRQAELERQETRGDRSITKEWVEQQRLDRQVELYHQVSRWLRSQELAESNQTRYRTAKAQQLTGTCDWLASSPQYNAWSTGNPSQPSIIWLHAHPGCGKTTLFAHCINSVWESDTKAAVAFHFYQFDKPQSAIEILRLLADQLFEKYWNDTHNVSDDVYSKTLKSSSSLENIRDFIIELVKALPKTFLLLDGLDEECTGPRWTDAQAVLDILVKLAIEFPGSIRLWYSSQYRACIHDKLGEYAVLDIKPQIQDDVTQYLSLRIRELHSLGVPDEEGAKVLDNLRRRADGNFLWASLMVKALMEEASSVAEIKAFIEDGLPSNLDAYYRTIFERMEKSHRKLASKLFSMVVYARRPLQMKEVQEAIGLLQSANPRCPSTADQPFAKLLRKNFAPLIVFQDVDEDRGPECRLFHSTLRQFLLKNPDVIGGSDRDLHISSAIIFNACLSYLSQDRYQNLLTRKDASWLDGSGSLVENHHFLLYAAKYWDKHLDDISETDELRTRVQDFLTSPHFLTCIQTQSLWVDGQFEVFYLDNNQDNHRAFLRRMFPAWFSGNHGGGNKLWRDFRAFLHEWRYFLECGSCVHPNCAMLPYAGLIDRCFWNALGPNNFLSNRPGRYKSFVFQNTGLPDDHLLCQSYEGISVSGTEVIIMRLISYSERKLIFSCDTWRLADNSLPVLCKEQIIETDDSSTNWLLYMKYSGNEPSMRAGRANPVAFSTDCQLLRIGSQIYSRDREGNYVRVLCHSTGGQHYPPYIEDIAARGQFTILSSRRGVTAEDVYRTGIIDTRVEDFGTAFTAMEQRLFKSKRFKWEADSDSDHGPDEYLSSDSSVDSVNLAYETWSEGSTDFSDVDFEGDVINQWTARVASLGATSSSSSSSSLISHASNDEPVNEKPDSDSDSDIPKAALFGYNRYQRDDSSDSELGMILEDYWENAYSYSREKSSALCASVIVIDTTSSFPKEVFHFTRKLSFMLYDSPPVIHPSKSLLVWPLSNGDMLFADFLAKSYFIRKLRPSTAHTRHIFMKVHFSICGRYLHIASLEGQRKPAHKSLKLCLMVLTYRLSERKTTRSPPSLIYRTRMSLGQTESLSVSRLPFTLTWTAEELYFTVSDVVLKVSRIRLFKDTSFIGETSENRDVLVPQKTTFLPNTARRRPVHFYPQGSGLNARVIIESESKTRNEYSAATDTKFFGLQSEEGNVCATTDVHGLRGMLSPPIGCYLTENDIGNWVHSKTVTEIPEDLGIGKMDRKLEIFNPEDDCDLEPYIF